MKRKLLMFITGLMVIGLITSSVAAAGVSINIEENNDIVKIMDDIHLPSNEEVPGDIIAVMGDIKIDGRVKGDVVSVLGDIEVNNEVEGNVVSILGNIKRGPEGKILGEITRISGFDADLDFAFPFAFGVFGWGFKFFKLIVLYGLTILVFVLMPAQQHKMVESLKENSLRKLGIGLVSLMLLPIIIFIMTVSIIGIPFIPVIVLGIIIVKFIGYVAVALFLGSRIREAGKIKINVFIQLLAGVVILWLLRSVPIIGIVFYLIVSAFALGTVIDTKFGTNNPWFNKEEIKDISDKNDINGKEETENDK